jgi:hypothetical protein
MYIHTQAKDRINEKRTFFGRQAIKIVSAFFNTTNFADNRAWVAEYALWATRPNGPGIWEIPTPIDCLYPEKSSGYIVCPTFILYLSDLS